MSIDVTPELLARFDRPAPRYTSYPTADRFTEAFGAPAYRGALERSDPGAPLVLYFHIPFCLQLCAYCGCNVVVTKDEGTRRTYLERLRAEVQMVAAALKGEREVIEVQFGGGTPNNLSAAQLAALLHEVRGAFALSPNATISIEVDPRRCEPGDVTALADVGFNRLSCGVQDLDPDVQKAIRREQSFEQTAQVVHEARAAGMQSVNLDLIYGLPLQTPEKFRHTIERVLTLDPDRIALFSFAWIPKVRPNQRWINEEDLPSRDVKLGLFSEARRLFLNAGFVAVGMDHFAKRDDALAQAKVNGELCRSFQGYTTGRGTSVIGLGVSAISDIGGVFSQNHKRLAHYNDAIDAGELPVARGLERSEVDEVVRACIEEVMCNGVLNRTQMEARLGQDLSALWQQAKKRLWPVVQDGLCTINDDELLVTEVGELFVRLVAAGFDPTFDPSRAGRYSRII